MSDSVTLAKQGLRPDSAPSRSSTLSFEAAVDASLASAQRSGVTGLRPRSPQNAVLPPRRHVSVEGAAIAPRPEGTSGPSEEPEACDSTLTAQGCQTMRWEIESAFRDASAPLVLYPKKGVVLREIPIELKSIWCEQPKPPLSDPNPEALDDPESSFSSSRLSQATVSPGSVCASEILPGRDPDSHLPLRRSASVSSQASGADLGAALAPEAASPWTWGHSGQKPWDLPNPFTDLQLPLVLFRKPECGRVQTSQAGTRQGPPDPGASSASHLEQATERESPSPTPCA